MYKPVVLMTRGRRHWGQLNKPSQTYIETQVSWQEMKKDSVQLICPGNLAASCVWKGKCNLVWFAWDATLTCGVEWMCATVPLCVFSRQPILSNDNVGKISG